MVLLEGLPGLHAMVAALVCSQALQRLLLPEGAASLLQICSTLLGPQLQPAALRQ